MLNVFSYARLVEDADGQMKYFVNPEFFPATMEHMASVKERPPEPLGHYWSHFKALPQAAIEAAHKPPEECPANLAEKRAAALEAARLYFTEMLHQAHGGGPMALKIFKTPGNTYRLAGPQPAVDGLDRKLRRFLGLATK